MTGWRLAFAVGNTEMLKALASVKSNLDSGVFQAVQHAGMAALEGIDRPEIHELTEMYRHRRDLLVDALQSRGWPVKAPEATFYLWAKCPQGHDSMSVASRLLDEANVVVIPGAGFGPTAEGYVRFSLTVSEERTIEAIDRIMKLKW
jgi:LL-diaminopimelate aminotransferase